VKGHSLPFVDVHPKYLNLGAVKIGVEVEKTLWIYARDALPFTIDSVDFPDNGSTVTVQPRHSDRNSVLSSERGSISYHLTIIPREIGHNSSEIAISISNVKSRQVVHTIPISYYGTKQN
jgi:hypothetical protein